jgi:hypothetical protein
LNCLRKTCGLEKGDGTGKECESTIKEIPGEDSQTESKDVILKSAELNNA